MGPHRQGRGSGGCRGLTRLERGFTARASAHGADRWWFVAGAALASTLWFFALVFGARLLGRWLSTARACRILDVVIGTIMVVLAAHLAFSG